MDMRRLRAAEAQLESLYEMLHSKCPDLLKAHAETIAQTIDTCIEEVQDDVHALLEGHMGGKTNAPSSANATEHGNAVSGTAEKTDHYEALEPSAASKRRREALRAAMDEKLQGKKLADLRDSKKRKFEDMTPTEQRCLERYETGLTEKTRRAHLVQPHKSFRGISSTDLQY